MINLKWAIWKKLDYTKSDLESLQIIQHANPELIDCLIRLIGHRLKETKPSKTLLDSENYTAKRTFLDGRAYELEWLFKLLNEGEVSDVRDDHLGGAD